MFLHNLVHSDEKRMARQIIIRQQQLEHEENWYTELKEKVKEMGIDTNFSHIENTSKSTWKQTIKLKIKARIQAEFEKETEEKKKLRFLKGKAFKKEDYIDETDAKTCQTIMSIRLNMTNNKMNYKNQHTDTMCVGCFTDEETTEHLFHCAKYKELTGHTMSLDKNCHQMNSTQWLVEAAQTMDLIEEIRSKREKVHGMKK